MQYYIFSIAIDHVTEPLVFGISGVKTTFFLRATVKEKIYNNWELINVGHVLIQFLRYNIHLYAFNASWFQ